MIAFAIGVRGLLAALALGLLLALSGAPVASGQGLAIEQRNRGTVVSVDGPRDFTIRRAGKLYAIRLGEIDTPRGATATRRAECGARLVTRALRRLAPRAKRLSVYVSGERESGRWLGDAQPIERTADGAPSFSSILIAKGLAREGLPQSVNAPVIPNANTLDLAYVPDSGPTEWLGDGVSHARLRRGVWGACNGRFHAPGGNTPPAVRPAKWVTTADGQTMAVGGLRLPTTVPPARGLTLGNVAAAFADLEIVRAYDGLCVGTSGRAGLWFQGQIEPKETAGTRGPPCSRQAVRSITSLGASGTSSGPAVGDPSSVLAGAFPATVIRDNPFYAELDGSDASTGACDRSPEGRWRTASVLHAGKIWGWFTRLPAPC